MIIIDRFENEYAVIEDGDKTVRINRNLLPNESTEGDVLSIINGIYVIDKEETKKRREETLALLKKLGL